MARNLKAQDHITISAPGGYENILPADETRIPADIAIQIKRTHPDYGQFDFALFGVFHKRHIHFNGVSTLKFDEILTYVQDCRDVWEKNVVNFKIELPEDPSFRPFDRSWDLQKDSTFLTQVAPALARAGDLLFRKIFEIRCNRDLRRLAEFLKTKLRSHPCYITIYSSDLFLPWGLFYTHPIEGEQLHTDGSNWKKEGFWGYSHIVQQNPYDYDRDSKIRLSQDGSVFLSVNFDDRLAERWEVSKSIIENHINVILEFAQNRNIKRTKKSKLELAFTRQRRALEPILYFYCHGVCGKDEPPYLAFSDGNVQASDFQNWSLDEGDGANSLPTCPFVFINACKSGQIQTMFYRSFADELLREGAVGLIGPQVRVPVVFGSAYAEQIFTRFFTGNTPMGLLVRDINQEMWDNHNNPLGLVYSLNRGVDCLIEWS